MTQENQPTQSNQTEKLMNYDECAAYIGISVSTLRRRVREKKVPCIKMGHQIVRFHGPTVLAHLNAEK